jgi:hypothetical protein
MRNMNLKIWTSQSLLILARSLLYFFTREARTMMDENCIIFYKRLQNGHKLLKYGSYVGVFTTNVIVSKRGIKS